MYSHKHVNNAYMKTWRYRHQKLKMAVMFEIWRWQQTQQVCCDYKCWRTKQMTRSKKRVQNFTKSLSDHTKEHHQMQINWKTYRSGTGYKLAVDIKKLWIRPGKMSKESLITWTKGLRIIQSKDFSLGEIILKKRSLKDWRFTSNYKRDKNKVNLSSNHPIMHV